MSSDEAAAVKRLVKLPEDESASDLLEFSSCIASWIAMSWYSKMLLEKHVFYLIRKHYMRTCKCFLGAIQSMCGCLKKSSQRTLMSQYFFNISKLSQTRLTSTSVPASVGYLHFIIYSATGLLHMLPRNETSSSLAIHSGRMIY